jgi:hypothetical protein
VTGEMSGRVYLKGWDAEERAAWDRECERQKTVMVPTMAEAMAMTPEERGERWAEVVDATLYLTLGFRDEQTVGELRAYLRSERGRFGATSPPPGEEVMPAERPTP